MQADRRISSGCNGDPLVESCTLGVVAAAREEHLSNIEQERQVAFARSWDNADAALADPEFRADLEAAIERVNASIAPRLSRDEFLDSTS